MGLLLLASLLSEAATLGVAASLVLLALAQPAFRLTRQSVESGSAWPNRLALAATFLDRDGREIGRRGIRHEGPLQLDQISADLVAATVATEDRRFFAHRGVDQVGTLRALVANTQAGRVVQGGSTITQQLAKTLFLTPERTFKRKITEAFLAIWLEARMSKPEILALYLGRVYLGADAFGMPAAAQLLFGKPADRLTTAESAMLAGVLKAPSRFSPQTHLAAAQARANQVLDAMIETGHLSAEAAERARREPAVPIGREPARHPDYYLDWVFGELRRLADAGRLRGETVVTVRTPLDGALQGYMETRLDALLTLHGDRYGVGQAAMVVMDPDGLVRAMTGGRDYSRSQFNRATDGLRQPGSAFKPFVYAAALTHARYTPDSVVDDVETCIGTWCPRNYGRSHAGPLPLWMALARSVNTVPVQLSIAIGQEAGFGRTAAAAQAGRARIGGLAARMGLTHPLRDSPSIPLGSAEATLLDMTAGYAAFANGGQRAPPRALLEVLDGQGRRVWAHDSPVEPAHGVLRPDVVADMNLMLSRVPAQGTGRRAALAGIPSAGKTGTTNDYRDAWYVGFTGHLVAGAWFGNDDFSPTRQLTGGTLPAMWWRDVMTFAHRGLGPKRLAGVPERLVPGVVVARGGFGIVSLAEAGGFAPAGNAASALAGRGFREVTAAVRGR